MPVFLALAFFLPTIAAAPDEGSIRLGNPSPDPEETVVIHDGTVPPGDADARRGFDYERFQTRLESQWFQRKAFLADGADDKAAEQAELIRAFCREEGIHHLEPLAGALLAETRRHLDGGQYSRALAALELAESLDAGRPQLHFARAAVYWKAAGRNGEALLEGFKGLGAALSHSIKDLSLFRRAALTLVVALAGTVLLFSVIMLCRYQLPFRHEVEEFVLRRFDERLARPAGWIALLLPVLVWVMIGWAALYWMAITFRFMRRGERAAAVALILACAAALPMYRGAVAVYGLTADPIVRTTLASSNGEYDPDRIVRLRKLVDAHPNDAAYRFLLGGLYKNGRFFEEAFEAYKQALDLDPEFEQAYINIGNIFSTTGQYGEAVAHYQKAIDIAPESVLAYFNMHLAQSESFRFRNAEESLRIARGLDAGRVTEWMSSSEGAHSTVIDAQLEVGTLWGAALGGRAGHSSSAGSIAAALANPVGSAAAVALLACFVFLYASRKTDPARRCIRCGDAFCDSCKRSTEGHEYCTQCLHLYVLGESLSPETKTKKIFEVERHERRTRTLRRLLSWTLPGTAQLVRGRAVLGTALVLFWLAAWIGAFPTLVGRLGRFVGMGLRLDLLETSAVPVAWTISAFGVLSALLGLAAWSFANGWLFRHREI